jgi:preprotein translocase subunit SecA
MAATTKFGLGRVLTGLFGTKHERDMRPLRPVIEAVHAASEPLAALTEEQLRGKTDEFRARLAAGETVDDLMVEAFAVVKEACRRNVGRSWSVVGRETTWDMVPFDVQLLGALVLHQGKIAEMATGEGKTLVAVMPLYLNALPGKGCHLVTVNDYLARRDSEWMGAILRYLGLTVGVIQHDIDNTARRAAYACDITYGTNNEFGFDYLRDNMAVRQEDQVQRGHHYAIVDEVDSVLVDEARTPLIISGPVAATHQRYDALRDPVESLVRAQNRLVGELLNEAETQLAAADAGTGKSASDSEYGAGLALLQVQRAAPKNKRFLKLIAERNLKELIHRVETDYMRDKQLHRVDEELYFSIDEREHSINLSDKGRALLRPGDPDYFMLPDLAEAVGRVDADATLDAKQKIAAKQQIHLGYAGKSDELHTIHQLLRAFCLYDRDGEYVVQEDKVLIVDEFTGRLMPGRRYSDGLHQALEAKERVRVEGETQTWATITLQNYFRLYSKLAGMTGTAETEAGEFWQIYKLDVIVVPPNEPVRRVDYDDVVFRTRREKYNAIIDEIARVHEQGRPVLVGTVSVEASETISRMLRRRGIEHSVLNAKFHQQEAEIVAGAGRPGAVTIATNMAGRGTDIKLGPGVRKGRKCLVRSPAGVGDCQATVSAGACEADMPCGLHIIGTERHESRRIDRQLRGRSGRQGDPGASRFFISFEDDLMRLFGSERVGSLMDRMGAREGEAIEHPLVTKAIERAQKRVEEHNFSIRKHLLEYDDVMTQQREVVYGVRKQILAGESIREEIQSLFETLIARKLQAAAPARAREESEDDASRLREACEELERVFLVPFPLADLGAAPAKGRAQASAGEADDPLVAEALRIAREAYLAREEEWGEAAAREVERQVYLRVIDDHWKDHLYEIDVLRGGIGLRSYGQKDPLLEYKAEAYQMFETLMDQVQEETLKLLFRVQLRREPAPPPPPPRPAAGQAMHAAASGFAAGGAAPPAAASAVSPTGTPLRESASGEAAARRGKTPVRSIPKVGRNDLCPCGSGRKYKHCHGTQPE